MGLNSNVEFNVENKSNKWIEAQIEMEKIKSQSKKDRLENLKEIYFKILSQELFAFLIVGVYVIVMSRLLFIRTKTFEEMKDILSLISPLVTTYLGYSIGKNKK